MTTVPTYSSLSVSPLVGGASSTFSSTWTDSNGLSHYIFSYDSGTGTMVNGSSVPIAGTTYTISMAETLPSSGVKAQWQVYVEDTNGVWNSTRRACLIPGASGSPSSSSYVTVVDDCYDLLAYSGSSLYNLGNLPQLVRTATTSVGYHVIQWDSAMDTALIVGYNDALVRYASGSLTILSTGLASSIGLDGVAWMPSSNFALISADSGHLLSYNGGSISAVSSGTSQTLSKVAWSPSGAYALIAGNAGTLLKYTYSGGTVTSLSTGTKQNLEGVDFSPDGSIAIIDGTGGLVLKYTASNGAISTLSGVGNSYQFQDVKFSSDGVYALLTSQNNARGELVEWTTSSMVFTNVTGSSNTANQIAFSQDDSYAYVTTTGGYLLKVLYNANGGSQIPLSDNRLRGIAFYSPSTTTMTTSGGGGGSGGGSGGSGILHLIIVTSTITANSNQTATTSPPGSAYSGIFLYAIVGFSIMLVVVAISYSEWRKNN
jgi:hypothetical protein